jgi:hypothetical protein
MNMGVAHEAEILASSPHGAIDHQARSAHRRRAAIVLGKTRDDLADLSGIENYSDDRHSASALGTGHDVQFVHLIQQPCPGFFSLPLKYPEVQDFQVTESWSSSQWIFSSDSGGRTMYWLNACRASWSFE